MNPVTEELLKTGGIAGILAYAVYWLYRHQTRTARERIKSYQDVVDKLEAKLSAKDAYLDAKDEKIEELWKTIAKLKE